MAPKGVCKRPAGVAFDSSAIVPMSLEDKMKLFRESGGQSEMNLSTAQQKQLSSRFNYSLDKAGARSQVESALNGLGKGLRQKGHQQVVQQWIISGGFTENFFEVLQSVSFDDSYKMQDLTYHMVLESIHSLNLSANASSSAQAM
eukprot:10953812-Alexandrium_andersonii.AAC.1